MSELRNIVNNLENRVLGIEKQFRALQTNNFIPRDEKTQKDDDAKDYYAVIIGRKTGIFTKWDGRDGAEAQVKGFSGAYHKKFKNLKDAIKFFSENI